MKKHLGIFILTSTFFLSFPLWAKEKTATAPKTKVSKVSKIDTSFGRVKLGVNKSLGTFHVQAVNESGKIVNLLSSNEEYTSTSFYLKSGNTVYKLSGGKGIQRKILRTERGAALLYVVPGKVQVEVDFICFASDPNYDEDMVKVLCSVKNLSKKKDKFGLKLVLDTILGEKNKTHFYTNENLPVINEKIYRNDNDLKWVVSKNDENSLQILVDGADISPLDYVALANYNTLNSSTWEPNMLTVRTFDNVLSYNNSALGLFWKDFSLNPQESQTFVFYMAVATDHENANGQFFLDNVNKKVKPKAKSTAKKVEPVLPPVLDDEVSSKNDEPLKSENEVKEVNKVMDLEMVEIPVKKTPEFRNVKFDVDSVSAEQLQPEYIQNLLNRIDSLEEEDPSLNREELLQLNAELNVILEILRAR